MNYDSDFGRLIERGLAESNLSTERIVEILLTHARHSSDRLSKSAETLDKLATSLDELAELVKQQQKELAQNTEITTAIRDAVNAGRVLHKVGKWLTAVLISIAMLWGAWVTVSGGNGHNIDAGP